MMQEKNLEKNDHMTSFFMYLNRDLFDQDFVRRWKNKINSAECAYREEEDIDLIMKINFT